MYTIMQPLSILQALWGVMQIMWWWATNVCAKQVQTVSVPNEILPQGHLRYSGIKTEAQVCDRSSVVQTMTSLGIDNCDMITF